MKPNEEKIYLCAVKYSIRTSHYAVVVCDSVMAVMDELSNGTLLDMVSNIEFFNHAIHPAFTALRVEILNELERRKDESD